MAEKSKMSGFKSVPSGEDKCIWMEAGVIDYKLCNYYYNCHECPFDKAMKQTTEKNAAARLQGGRDCSVSAVTLSPAGLVSGSALMSMNVPPANLTKCWKIVGKYRFQLT
jgi:hypothetical protein